MKTRSGRPLTALGFLFLCFCSTSPGQQVPPARLASTNTPPPAPPPAAAPTPAGAADLVRPVPETITPTWETQVDARTCYFEIPAPRGQITDRHGLPLAQSRLGYHLDLSFPNAGPEMSDAQVFAYVKEHLVEAQTLLHRPLELSTNEVLDHYRNRRILPMDIVTYLGAEDVNLLRGKLNPPLSLRPVYLRYYPNGPVAGHIIGYVGKTGAQAHGPLQANETLWPNLEGREGLELTFNEQLTGKNGSLNITFDGQGNKTSERVLSPPVPGKNVVTTLDLNLQRMCEEMLAKGRRPGAIVITDPNNGDVLALASWPTFDPNLFVPAISNSDFQRLNQDPNNPLIPRAYRASYPAGSTFKVIIGIAALQSHTISKDTEFPGPASFTIGSIVMHNWKKTDAGDLNFVQALTQSCDTWFYQVGIKTGADRIVDWGQRFGFGKITGLPLRDEDKGLMPDNAFMRRVHHRKLLDGDIANISIGQGDLLVTPVQMAQAMGTIANGGTFYQTRLVQHIQTLDDEVVSGYPIHPRLDVGISDDVLATVKKGMIGVIESGNGTAHQAHVPGVTVAGKTGTAQWGAGNRNKQLSRTAAWFVGFAPADHAKYAFAAVVEGAAGETGFHGGQVAAPMIGKILRELYKDQKHPSKKKKHDDDDDDEDNGHAKAPMDNSDTSD